MEHLSAAPVRRSPARFDRQQQVSFSDPLLGLGGAVAGRSNTRFRESPCQGWGPSTGSGDQDELAADMTASTDGLSLGGAFERERLHLDHQLVLGQ